MKKDMFKKGDIVQYIRKSSYQESYYAPMDSYAHRMSICNEFAVDDAFTHMEIVDVVHDGEEYPDTVFPSTNKTGQTVYVTKIDKPGTYEYYFNEDELLLVKSV